jgi:hypothetical protein
VLLLEPLALRLSDAGSQATALISTGIATVLDASDA